MDHFARVIHCNTAITVHTKWAIKIKFRKQHITCEKQSCDTGKQHVEHEKQPILVGGILDRGKKSF